MAILFRILALVAVPLLAAREIDCAAGERVSIRGESIRMSGDFQGRAAIHIRGACEVELTGLRIDGNRKALPQGQALPPSNIRFADHYRANGVLVEGARTLVIRDSQFSEIAAFAILASAVGQVRIANVSVSDSGSLNAKGRNNTTGGILLEDGTANFVVEDCVFERILGNALWTHSRYRAQRNGPGTFTRNRFDGIGRDAIQVGHASKVTVTKNTIRNTGRPDSAVDVEGGGTPVGIDTAGDVDFSSYSENVMSEINGKCIDLDGFHHGEVLSNECINEGGADAYAFGHFGIVMNNTNPDMQAVAIRIEKNRIAGMRFGAVFVIGSGHTIRDNRFTRLHTGRCAGCTYFPGEPDLLRAGIYLGRRAERPAATRGNLIEGNAVEGWGMAKRCIVFAPGVKRSENRQIANRCGNGRESK